MEVYLESQIRQLVWAVAFGLFAGVLYDLIRVLGAALGNKRRHLLKDALFWSVTILSVFFFNVALFSGETSFYFPFAMGVGAMLYLHLMSRAVSAAFYLLVFPLKKLRELIQRGFKELKARAEIGRQARKKRAKAQKHEKIAKKTGKNANNSQLN